MRYRTETSVRVRVRTAPCQGSRPVPPYRLNRRCALLRALSFSSALLLISAANAQREPQSRPADPTKSAKSEKPVAVPAIGIHGRRVSSAFPPARLLAGAGTMGVVRDRSCGKAAKVAVSAGPAICAAESCCTMPGWAGERRAATLVSSPAVTGTRPFLRDSVSPQPRGPRGRAIPGCDGRPS